MYESFAYLYDALMEDIPYEEWAKTIIHILQKHGINSGIIADLGCGTGSITRQLAAAGYDMIGIDSSEEMLGIARQNIEVSNADNAADYNNECNESNSERNILYLEQDICEFELYGTVAAIICTCDTINYITESERLEQLFKLVVNYLDTGGLFIFDIKTLYTFREILGWNTFVEHVENGSIIWENSFDEDSMQNTYELTMYVSDENHGLTMCEEDDKNNKVAQNDEDVTYRRYEEVHVQRAYTDDEIKMLAERTGLQIISKTDGYSDGEIKENSERVLYVMRNMIEKQK